MTGALLGLARAVAPVPAAALLADAPALVVIAPHPDDETLGCGALIHEAACRGLPTRIICVTTGNRSHPRSQSHPPAVLAALRRAEFEAAVDLLSPDARRHWLGHDDCGLPEDPAGLARELDVLCPQGALVLTTWQGDPHIDHQRTAMAAGRLCARRGDLRLLSYPVWGRFPETLPQPAGRLIRLSATPGALARKAAALTCHRSQMTPLIADDPGGFVMSAGHQAHFLTEPEIYLA